MKNLLRRTGVAVLCLNIVVPWLTVRPTRAVETALPAVVINELMWMGSSVSSSDEWLELQNTTDKAVDIAGWRLTKFSGGTEQPMLTIPSGQIVPGGFFLVANYPMGAQSRLATMPDLVNSAMSLSNSDLQVGLYDATGNVVDVAGDRDTPLAGDYTSGSVWASMERMPGGIDGTVAESWYTSSTSVNFLTEEIEKGTPGVANSNMPPMAVAGDDVSGRVNVAMNFDGSASSDPEGTELTFAWDFGDGGSASGVMTNHLFSRAGEFTVTLNVSDGQTETEDSLLATITMPDGPRQPFPLKLDERDESQQDGSQTTGNDTDESMQEKSFQTSSMIWLSELLPDPTGRDETDEFIELSNAGDEPVNLTGWKLTDGKTDFELDGTIEPEDYVTILRPQSKIALNNSGDTVFVVDPFGKTINGVTYGKSVSGKSFSRQGSTEQWVWTEPTPGTTNEVRSLEDDETIERSAVDETAKGRNVSLAEARQLPLRTTVMITGSVIALPGQLGETMFYVGDNQSGLQVYSSQADFPALALGESITVVGQVGRSDGEVKVNVKSADDIVIINRGPDVSAVPVEQLTTGEAGRLVTVVGQVASKQRQRLEVRTSQSSVAVTVKASTGIDMGSFKVDDQVSIAGIVQATSSGIRLLPRSPDDIVAVVPEVAPIQPVAHEANADQGVQPVTEAGEETVSNDQRERMIMIGLGLAVGLGLAGRVLWPRRRQLLAWITRRPLNESPRPTK